MGSQLYICTFYGHELCCMSSRVLFTKSNNTLQLGFQENQSFLHIMLRNYQFMCTAQACGKHKQCAKKVVSDSLGLVDFAIGLVNSVRNLPDGQVKFFEEFKLHKNCVINPAYQKVFGAS